MIPDREEDIRPRFHRSRSHHANQDQDDEDEDGMDDDSSLSGKYLIQGVPRNMTVERRIEGHL